METNKIINLGEILDKVLEISKTDSLTTVSRESIIEAMFESCKQVLSLAVDNAEVDVEMCMGQRTGSTSVDELSILNTIKQVSKT